MKLKQEINEVFDIINWKPPIKDSWNIHKMKFLLERKVTDGPHETPIFTDEGYPFLSVDSIQDGEIIFEGCRYISDEDHVNFCRKCKPKKDDVFMGKAASIGKIARVKVDFEFSIWSPLALLRANKKILNPSFFEYSLKSDYAQDQIEIFATSNTQKNISMDDIPRIQILIPSIEEQTTIANFLDKKTFEIDDLIAKNKKLIELEKEKRIALINHVVTKGLDTKVKMKDSGIDWIGEIPEGWEVKKLKFVSDVKVSNVDKKSQQNEPEVQLCNYTDVYYNEFITENLNFMKATSSYEQKKKFQLQKEDVMITKDSETPEDIAVPAVSTKNFKDVVCGYHLAFIRPDKDSITGNYLLRSFQSKSINTQFVIWALGVTRFGISTYPIKNSYFLVPPKQEQQQIAEYLDKHTSLIDRTIKKIEKNIELLEEYKISLIHHVVTGKVDVRGVAA